MFNLIDEVSIYSYYSNNEQELNYNEISNEFSIEEDKLLIFFSGVLNSFKDIEPHRYYDDLVLIEVYERLEEMYNKNEENFYKYFYKYHHNFFNAINSYHKMIDLYNEFDDVDFERDIKTKIYIIPMITQTLEFCLNHFYRGIASILGEYKGKDNSSQKTLSQLRNALKSDFKSLIDIDVDFRNAISHGTLQEIIGITPSFMYEYVSGRDKKTNKNIIKTKEIKLDEVIKLKDKYLDISSGAILSLILFMNNKNILREDYLNKLEEYEKFDYVKLLLHSENVRIKSFSNGTIGTPQLNVHVSIKNINDTNKIYFICITILKILNNIFPNYDRYHLNYYHPYSIGGFISLSKEEILNINNGDTSLDNEGNFPGLLPPIQNQDIDYRAYRFYSFPKFKTNEWELKSIEDNSIEDYKRFKATVLILKENISKKEIENIVFQATSKIKSLENRRNPITPIKYGKVDADIVSLHIYYKTKKRNKIGYLDNKSFICESQYYRTKSITHYSHYPINTKKEVIKKWDIYWNKSFL